MLIGKTVPWYSAVFGIVGVISLTFAVTVYIVNRPVSRLTMVETSYATYPRELTTTPSNHTVEVLARFDNTQIDDLQHAIFTVRNTGNQTVTPLASERLYIKFPEGVTILSADIDEAPQYDASFHASPDPGKPQVVMTFARLKPKEQARISVFFSGNQSETPTLLGRSPAALVTLPESSLASVDYRKPAWSYVMSGVTLSAGVLFILFETFDLTIRRSKRRGA